MKKGAGLINDILLVTIRPVNEAVDLAHQEGDKRLIIMIIIMIIIITRLHGTVHSNSAG